MPKDNQSKKNIDGNENNDDLGVAEGGTTPEKEEKGGTNENGKEGAVGQPVVSVPVPLGGIGEVVPGQFSDASSSDGDLANTAAVGTSSGVGKDGDSAHRVTGDNLGKEVGGTAAAGPTDKGEKLLRGPAEQKECLENAVNVAAAEVEEKITAGGKAAGGGDDKTSVALSSRNTQPQHAPTSDFNLLPGSVTGAVTGVANPPPSSASPQTAPVTSAPPSSTTESKGIEGAQTQQPIPNKNPISSVEEKQISSVAMPNTKAPLQRTLPRNVHKTNPTTTTAPAPVNASHSLTKATVNTSEQPSKPQIAPIKPSVHPISNLPLQIAHGPDAHRKRALPLPHGATTAAEAAAAAVAAANAVSASPSLLTSTAASVIPKTQMAPRAPVQAPSSHKKAIVNPQNVTVQRAGAFNNPPPASLPNVTKTAAVAAPTSLQPALQTQPNKLPKTASPIPASAATIVSVTVSAPLSAKATSTSVPTAAASKPVAPTATPGRGRVTPTTTTATKSQNAKIAKSVPGASSRPQASSNKITSTTTATANDKNESASSTNVAAAGGAVSMPQIKVGQPPQIADPAVIKAVHDILGLLQIYGPLTHDQLEYNLPPLNQTPSSSAIVGGASSGVSRVSSGNGSSRLQQILDILVVTGIVNIVADDSLQIEDSSAAPDSIQSSGLGQGVQIPSHPPRYAFLRGVPRADTIMPSKLLSQLRDAHKEVEQTKERIEILRNELRVISDDDNETGGDIKTKDEETTSEMEEEGKGTEKISGGATDDVSTKHKKRKKEKKTGIRSAREVLKSLLLSYPEIIYDPVYAAALRSLNIDIGAVDRERERGYSVSSKKRKASSPSAKESALGSNLTSSSAKKKKNTGKASSGGASDTTKATSSPKAAPPTPTSSTNKEPATGATATDSKNIIEKNTSTAVSSISSSG